MARVILGVGAGIAAYKACELLRLLKEAGHRVRVVPDRRRAALRRRADLGGAVRRAGRHRRLDRRRRRAARAARPDRRPGRGRPRDRRPARPRRRGPVRRPAHRDAADRPLPGGLRARDAHRDVGAPGHPGTTSRRCATAARSWSSPPSAGSPARTPARGACRSPASSFDARPECGCWHPERGAAGDSRGRARSLALARRVLVSAGGTREELDPVRFLGNWSTGRQGYAFARSAAARGADVTLVAANVELPDPAGREGHPGRLRPGHARRDARRGARPPTSVVMTAAVADFRPAARAEPEDQEGRHGLAAARSS